MTNTYLPPSKLGAELLARDYPYRIKSDNAAYYAGLSNVPSHDWRDAVHFHTKKDAERELHLFLTTGLWPLYVGWRVVRIKGNRAAIARAGGR